MNANPVSDFPVTHDKMYLRTKCNSKVVAAFCLVLFVQFGCQKAEEPTLVKKPRPVEVTKLTRTLRASKSMVAAPVASWKTEQIGFEVAGRVESVVEPNTDIEGRITDGDGNLIFAGTPVARLNTERFELQVESQTAQVSRAKQAIESAKIQLERTLPARMKAAQAEKKRAQTEYERSKRLVAQKAGARSDVDRDEAAYESAISQIEQLNASIKAQQAELESLDAQLMQAKDALRDAERNLEDCVLYASFRGQISETAVVPGSVVSAGAPVATIQMMDPIKVEVEVSAEDSRRLRNRQRLPVMVTLEDGTIEERDGYLYLVDPVADALTRTFTLTLLVTNDRLTGEAQALGVPTTDQTWRVDFEFLPGAGKGKCFVVEDSLPQDDDGYFVWKVTNMSIQGDLPPDRMLHVEKARVELGDAKVPFLGNWIFQEVRFVDDSFDPKSNLIAGRVSFQNDDASEWDEKRILFQNEGQWLLRPGDLVKVNLADSSDVEGYFVPMDAIAYEGERMFLFLLDEETSTVDRVEVRTSAGSNGTSSLVSVEPQDASNDLDGRKFVSRGAHYLIDGEKVRPVESEAAQ